LVHPLAALLDLGSRTPASRLQFLLDRPKPLGSGLLAITTGFLEPLVPGDRSGYLQDQSDGLVSKTDTDFFDVIDFEHDGSSFRYLEWIVASPHYVLPIKAGG
jgi:hypothetical protein